MRRPLPALLLLLCYSPASAETLTASAAVPACARLQDLVEWQRDVSAGRWDEAEAVIGADGGCLLLQRGERVREVQQLGYATLVEVRWTAGGAWVPLYVRSDVLLPSE